MSEIQYISLTGDGMRHTTHMHIGQDMRKIEFVFDDKTINANDILVITKWETTHAGYEISGVIQYFPVLNSFLQESQNKPCTIDVEIYEASHKKAYPYTGYHVKLTDYLITYPECGRSEAKLIFKRV